MEDSEKIRTVNVASELKYKEKGSVFIAKTFRVNNLDEVDSNLNKIKKEYYDASHHCYAYKLQNNNFKYSDDGEPTGTAGIRILNAIDHFGLTNILTVVIRYFGGVKLGVGPLGRAYYNSAYMVLDAAEKIILTPYKKIFIDADFSYTSYVHRILSRHKVIIKDTIFNTKVIFDCLSEEKEIEQVIKELNEISKGEIKIRKSEDISYI